MNIVFLSSESSHHYFLINEINRAFGVKKVFFQTVHEQRKPFGKRLKRWVDPRQFVSVADRFLYRLILGGEAQKQEEFERDYFWKGERSRLESSIPSERVSSFNEPAVVGRVRAENPDLIIVFGTEVLKGEMLSAARLHMFNIHRGILPEYRGGGIMTWMFLNNDFDHVGACVHICSAGLDAGDIAGQKRYCLQKDDKIYMLRAKTTVLAVEILKEVIEKAGKGTLRLEKQSGSAKTWSAKELTTRKELIARRNFNRYIKSLNGN